MWHTINSELRVQRARALRSIGLTIRIRRGCGYSNTMKTNEGIKPTPSRGVNRPSSPRLIAIASSVLSVIVVAGYYYFFAERGISRIGEKNETAFFSRTPERAAESFLTALTDNKIELALNLCKNGARNSVLDRSIFHHLTRAEEIFTKTTQTGKTRFGGRENDFVEPAVESRKSNESTPKAAINRSPSASDQSSGERNTSRKGKARRREPVMRNGDYRLSEPLIFTAYESHSEEKDRVLLVGTLKSKNTGRIYFSNVKVTTERSNSLWYVTRVRFK